MAFWTHLTNRSLDNQGSESAKEKRRGGLALVIKKEFLSKFNAHSWDIVTLGRLAVLHLAGNEGGTRYLVCILAGQL